MLDQFSRNLFRGDPRAFAVDAQALTLAQEAVACGADQALTQQQRTFAYMPYMHSESAAIHVHVFSRISSSSALKPACSRAWRLNGGLIRGAPKAAASSSCAVRGLRPVWAQAQ